MAVETNLSLGEYLLSLAVLAVIAFGVIGYLFGTGFGGVLIFIVGAVAVLILGYVILARVWRYLLHGSTGSSSRKGGGDAW